MFAGVSLTMLWIFQIYALLYSISDSFKVQIESFVNWKLNQKSGGSNTKMEKQFFWRLIFLLDFFLRSNTARNLNMLRKANKQIQYVPLGETVNKMHWNFNRSHRGLWGDIMKVVVGVCYFLLFEVYRTVSI